MSSVWVLPAHLGVSLSIQASFAASVVSASTSVSFCVFQLYGNTCAHFLHLKSFSVVLLVTVLHWKPGVWRLLNRPSQEGNVRPAFHLPPSPATIADMCHYWLIPQQALCDLTVMMSQGRPNLNVLGTGALSVVSDRQGARKPGVRTTTVVSSLS